jgi:BCD family chlorophyll transporter-like MFS transporter
MMNLASSGRESREGVRMGLWGAAQSIAFGLGSFSGAALSDLAKWLIGTPSMAYSAVFALEALMFLLAAMLAAQINRPVATHRDSPVTFGDVAAAKLEGS